MSWTENAGKLSQRLAVHKPALYPGEELDELDDIRIGKLVTGGLGEAQLPFALAVKAGLHLFNESLYPSLVVSEPLTIPEGIYWRGIMRRMEGDYDEARACFRSAAGGLPGGAWAERIFAEAAAADLDGVGSERLRLRLADWVREGQFDPCVFTDLIEYQVLKARDPQAELVLKQTQWLEMRGLLDRCFAAASEGGALFEPI